MNGAMAARATPDADARAMTEALSAAHPAGPVAVWFWQQMVTPHMMGLARALAARECEVTYVAAALEDPERSQQGWEVPRTQGVRLMIASRLADALALADAAPPDSVHLCQGLRGNGFVGAVQRRLARRKLSQWAMLERVDDPGIVGWIKRIGYGVLARRAAHVQQGLLAIGHDTAGWLRARGMPASQIYPFAYFLDPADGRCREKPATGRPFTFTFVGQFIERKRLDLLIDALACAGCDGAELTVLGSGPDEGILRRRASELLGDKVRWIGRVPQSQVPGYLAASDCLVLPSRHDGWGAVVSEALLVGTPAICSDRCGAAAAVRASGRGGVFRAGDVAGLAALLRQVHNAGRASSADRAALAGWASCLSSGAGAQYLLDILSSHGEPAPPPPWEAEAR